MTDNTDSHKVNKTKQNSCGVANPWGFWHCRGCFQKKKKKNKRSVGEAEAVLSAPPFLSVAVSSKKNLFVPHAQCPLYKHALQRKSYTRNIISSCIVKPNPLLSPPPLSPHPRPPQYHPAVLPCLPPTIPTNLPHPKQTNVFTAEAKQKVLASKRVCIFFGVFFRKSVSDLSVNIRRGCL